MLRGVKNAIIKLSEVNPIGEMIYTYIKYATARFMRMILGDIKYARWFYHLYTGKNLNLENPQSFDEKLWWLKLNNRDPLLTRCSDKYAVREYIKECGYESILVPQFDLFDSAEQVDFSKYTEEVVVKCTHNSGGHIFYSPNEPIDKKRIRTKIMLLDFILHRNPSVLSGEWNYQNIEPRIIVEKVIRDQNGRLPLDYKFMCFDGEPKLLFLDLGLINDDSTYNHYYPRNIYNMEFELLPVFESRPNAPYVVEKPDNFELMVEIAKKLSSPFPMCRVDLYNVDGKVYFGEITFYHGSGCNNIQPEEWAFKMGEWINLNSDKIVRLQ